MEVTNKEARALVNFLSDMTQYEVGSHGETGLLGFIPLSPTYGDI